MLEDRPHRAAARDRRKRPRRAHILIATGAAPHLRARDPRPRARDLVERGVPSRRPAQAHPDPGRRLHRGRVRRHLHRARLRGDAGLSRRQHPARLRRRRARASARGDGAARHQDRHQADRSARSRTVEHGFCVELSDRRTVDGRQGDVRDRAAAERHGPRARGGRRRARRAAAASRSTNSRRPRCRTSTRSATSPTAST